MKQQILINNLAYILVHWNDIDDQYRMLCHLNDCELRSWGLV